MGRATIEELCALQLGMGWFPEQAANGLDRVYHALAHHLPQVGIRIEGLVVGSDSVADLSAQTVRAFASDATSLPERLLKLRKTIRAAGNLTQYDLIAAHFALYAFPALDLIKGRPLVVHFHGPWSAESKMEGEGWLSVRGKAWIERAVYRRGDRFIVLSEAFRDVLNRDYGIPEERVRIIPGGVEAARFDVGHSQQAARDQLGWPQDRPILLSVRRLVKRVGLEGLIDSMDVLRRQVPEALLLIAGKGPLAVELNARIQAAKLDNHVRLLGFVPDDDLPLAYRAADCSVVPTLALEGFGLIAVESLAAGTPVLVAPVGGLPEVVQTLSPDLVLPGTDAGVLSDYLASVLTGFIRLPSAEACREYAQARFDWAVIASQVRGVYEEVVA